MAAYGIRKGTQVTVPTADGRKVGTVTAERRDGSMVKVEIPGYSDGWGWYCIEFVRRVGRRTPDALERIEIAGQRAHYKGTHIVTEIRAIDRQVAAIHAAR